MFWSHLAHPDRWRHKSDRPWHRGLRPVLFSSNATSSLRPLPTEVQGWRSQGQWLNVTAQWPWFDGMAGVWTHDLPLSRRIHFNTFGGGFYPGGSYSDIYIFCLQVDGPTTGAGVLYGAYIFIFDLIFPLLSFPFHLHLVEFHCVGRSCWWERGVAGETRLHSELFRAIQGRWFTQRHNRIKRQWNGGITRCAIWAWNGRTTSGKILFIWINFSVKTFILDNRNNEFFQFYIFIRNLVPFQASVKKQNTREARHLTIMIPTIQTRSKLFSVSFDS